MQKYIMRLDDACEKRDIEKWNLMEELLDKYGIKPLVGVIPHCEDPMMDGYSIDLKFWDRVNNWLSKGWVVAMHGYNHVYSTNCGGINPVNDQSEFSGESLIVQKEKIKRGIEVFRNHGIEPKVFFAPSHTFDKNTIDALKSESAIRIISDTIANRSYTMYGMTFVPQQTGRVRKLPFNQVTFCYHPNSMSDKDFSLLESFVDQNSKKFVRFPIETSSRKLTPIDKLLKSLYFLRR